MTNWMRALVAGALLFPVQGSAADSGKGFSDFSGVWEYVGKTELEGKIHVVQSRYTIFQKGRRVCGYVDRIGAPDRRYESYAFMGVAYRGHADLWLDAGSPASAQYSPRFPLEASDIVRLKLLAGRLLMGGTYRASGAAPLVFPAREREILYNEDMPLSHKPEPATVDDFHFEAPEAARTYVSSCLDAPVARD